MPLRITSGKPRRLFSFPCDTCFPWPTCACIRSRADSRYSWCTSRFPSIPCTFRSRRTGTGLDELFLWSANVSLRFPRSRARLSLIRGSKCARGASTDIINQTNKIRKSACRRTPYETVPIWRDDRNKSEHRGVSRHGHFGMVACGVGPLIIPAAFTEAGRWLEITQKRQYFLQFFLAFAILKGMISLDISRKCLFFTNGLHENMSTCFTNH